MSELEQYHFGFENLAFEGGGVKLIGHIGVILVSSLDVNSINAIIEVFA